MEQQSERKSREENGNQQPVICHFYCFGIEKHWLYMQLYIIIYICIYIYIRIHIYIHIYIYIYVYIYIHIYIYNIQEPLLILKRFIVILHTLSAYNSLIIRYEVYSSDPREGLWRICIPWYWFSTVSYVSFLYPIKNKLVITNCQPLILQKITL